MSENGLRTQVMHKALKKVCRQLSAIMLHLDPKGLRKETPKVTKKSEDNAEPPCEVKNIPLVKSEPVLSSMDRNAKSCQPFLSSVKKGFFNKAAKKVDVGIVNIFFDYTPFEGIGTNDPTSVSPIVVCQEDMSLDLDLSEQMQHEG